MCEELEISHNKEKMKEKRTCLLQSIHLIFFLSVAETTALSVAPWSVNMSL